MIRHTVHVILENSILCKTFALCCNAQRPAIRHTDIYVVAAVRLNFLNIGLIAVLIACLRYLRVCVWQELLAYRNSSEVAMSEVFGSTTKTCVELCDVVLLNAAKTKSLALACFSYLVNSRLNGLDGW